MPGVKCMETKISWYWLKLSKKEQCYTGNEEAFVATAEIQRGIGTKILYTREYISWLGFKEYEKESYRQYKAEKGLYQLMRNVYAETK